MLKISRSSDGLFFTLISDGGGGVIVSTFFNFVKTIEQLFFCVVKIILKKDGHNQTSPPPIRFKEKNR